MGDERPTAARNEARITRRGLLTLAGTSALAGCTTLDELADGGDPTIRAYDLPAIDRESVSESPIPPSVPVDVASAHFDSVRDRVTTLLAALPAPLGPAEIPNGHVRHRLAAAAADATTGLDDARDARTELVALQSLRRARERARYAAAGWAVADRGLTVEAVRREHGRTVAEAREVREAHEYVGTDPVRATLVHARIEEALRRAVDGTARPRDGSRLLVVAEWGETAESAQAHLDDARHLDARFVASLPDDAGAVDGTLTGAAETLLAEVRSRRSDLPPEPTAEEWGLPEMVTDDLRWEADNGTARVAEAVGPASAVVDANERLTQFRALDRVRERIDADGMSRPESAAAVRDVRTTAYEALEAALDESPAPEMTRTAVTDAAWRVVAADRKLDRYEGEITPASLDDVVADYILGTVIARAAPEASRRTVDALETA